MTGRPRSILIFERLFLASMIGSIIGFVLSYDAIADAIGAEPDLVRVGISPASAIAFFALTTAIWLLLYWLVAHRASNAAKWVLTVLTGLGLLMVPLTLASEANFAMFFSLMVTALGVGAVLALFRPDARDWLEGGSGVEDADTY
ncbi:hypothetical protein G7A66_10955 [Altererythrobacter sp. SALINAS58]|uniref:hypothetical protein n=1 Tax=Alteripontixanthobacter muriae TaxID=2705546 RepID=UPI0015765B57|nr:hypothetical protein [Alteripontixanthobacter muriae]NTZ43591.1 hypothetical protein [Alteripontixanthobacter muriae]